MTASEDYLTIQRDRFLQTMQASGGRRLTDVHAEAVQARFEFQDDALTEVDAPEGDCENTIHFFQYRGSTVFYVLYGDSGGAYDVVTFPTPDAGHAALSRWKENGSAVREQRTSNALRLAGSLFESDLGPVVTADPVGRWLLIQATRDGERHGSIFEDVAEALNYYDEDNDDGRWTIEALFDLDTGEALPTETRVTYSTQVVAPAESGFAFKWEPSGTDESRDQETDLPGPYFAEVGPNGDKWSWSILEMTEEGNIQVDGGNATTEAIAKGHVENWTPESRSQHDRYVEWVKDTITAPPSSVSSSPFYVQSFVVASCGEKKSVWRWTDYEFTETTRSLLASELTYDKDH